MKVPLRWVVTGTGVPSGVRRVFSTPLMALSIALIALANGLAASFFSAEIRERTRNFLLGEHAGRVDALVVIFWAAAMVWAALFYVRLIAESDEKRGWNTRSNGARTPEFFTRTVSSMKR